MPADSDKVELLIDLPAASAGEASRRLDDLTRVLATADRSIRATFRQSDPRAQDAGSVLAIVLGSASLVALCRGLQAFIAKRGDSIRVRLPNGEIVATGEAAKKLDPAAIVRAIQRTPEP